MTPGNRMTSGGRFRVLAFVLLLGAAAAAGGCSKSVAPTPPDPAPGPRLAPADVVNALQWAYKHHDAAVYGGLLADDFRFYFDPYIIPATVSEYWTRAEDSARTGNLFGATTLLEIRIQLTHGADTPDAAAGHERWRHIRVTKTFLQVDFQSPDGEPITFSGEGAQDFYVRRGFTPGDTLSTSPTAREWFLVEWHDLGQGTLSTAGSSIAYAPAPAEIRSWSLIKARFQ